MFLSRFKFCNKKDMDKDAIFKRKSVLNKIQYHRLIEGVHHTKHNTYISRNA